jgi:L,D-transpeptidase-like protein
VVPASHLPARVHLRGLCILAVGFAAFVAIGATDAQARPERTGKRTAHKIPPTPEKDKAKRPHGPILAVISLRRQRISVYGNQGLIAESVVSTGRSGYPTPTGVFSVIQKSRYHRSNIYSGAPMPFMQRITWSGVALHAGVVPGYPASHGCIRLTHSFAIELWGMTKVGARVIVAPDEVAAHELAHAALPVPMMTPAPEKVAESLEGEFVKTALATVAASDTSEDKAPPRLLNPLERAQAAKIQTAADAAVKAKAAKDAVEISALKAAEANKAIAALRRAELSAAAARDRLEAAKKLVDSAKTPEALERAKTAQAAAQTALEEAEKAAAEAASEESGKTAEAFAAAHAAWDAEAASAKAAAAVKAAERGAEPISIFISKKAGRVYVRQAWAPIYEAEVTFKEPDLPLGTHLYLATEPKEDGKAMRWLSVSMPPAPPSAETRYRARRDEGAAAVPAASASRPHATATGALERIELGAEARAFIEDKLWTGASLIVSDQGISNETGKYTDFIVLTR